MTEIRKSEVTPNEWQKALDGLEVGDEYRITSKWKWQKWCNDFMDKDIKQAGEITAIRKTPQSEEEYLTQARAEANSGKVVYKALSDSEQAEPQKELASSKPPQYQIGIDTFERSKANQMAETRVEIAKFMIDKYVWRKKGQDKEDFQKIKDYCDFAIEALNEIKRFT